MSTWNPCEVVIKEYLNKLQGDFVVESSDKGCFIITPFVRPDGESIELIVEMLPDDHFRLTDMGDTLGYLYVHGLTVSKNIIQDTRRICNRFGVTLEGRELVTELDNQGVLGESVHCLMQTVLSVTDLVQRRRPMERVRFDDEVESAIISSGVVYDSEYQVLGHKKSHIVRFHVNSSRNMLIQPISAASEPVAFSWAERWAFRFSDILQRQSSWKCIAVLDDRLGREQVWSDRALAPIKDLAVPWARKEQLEESLIRSG